ncbi:MAG: URC4/urg3 family protein [Bacteriovoracaceae bacterium]|nr:URC4/urg3 family protein [Bacteriovoracaceae bacterium]
MNIDFLLSSEGIRHQTNRIYELTVDGQTNFEYHPKKLAPVAEYVLSIIKENYPDYKIPFHSRWVHFQAGKINRNAKLDTLLESKVPLERARAKLDLAIVSVLLDAGAGPNWSFSESSGVYRRSEGLALASWHMFCDGDFSINRELEVAALKLTNILEMDIEQGFQVEVNNPLVGIKGRTDLLRALGNCILSRPREFKDARPGNILDHMLDKYGSSFHAKDLLKELLILFGEIWPSRLSLDGKCLGDVWSHPKLKTSIPNQELVPFHKLSQWLTYSLIEPMQEAGIEVTNIHELTGLAEYRNGGLLLDTGLITLKNQDHLNETHAPDSEVVIEWRALTVKILDMLAKEIREGLKETEKSLPLAKILEGGTWAAGRRIASEMRTDASPPLKVLSDGTLF